MLPANVIYFARLNGIPHDCALLTTQPPACGYPWCVEHNCMWGRPHLENAINIVNGVTKQKGKKK